MSEYAHQPPRSRGPLADVARKLAGSQDVIAILEPAVGRQLANRVIKAATHVRLRTVASPAGKARTAKADFEQGPLRERNSPVVKRLALVFLTVCSWLGPNKRTGHKKQGHRLRVDVLARVSGVSPREVERYLAVLRSAQIVRNWQPPKTSGAPKGRSGYCYALYELVGEMPRQLLEVLRRFHGSWWGSAIVGAAAPRGELDAQTIADALRGHFAPS